MCTFECQECGCPMPEPEPNDPEQCPDCGQYHFAE